MVQVNIGGIAQKLGQQKETVQKELCVMVLSSCGEYVPYRTGFLYSSGKITDMGIAWTADYAGKCYYNDRTYSKKAHPKATARWFEAAKSAHLNEWIANIKTKFK